MIKEKHFTDLNILSVKFSVAKVVKDLYKSMDLCLLSLSKNTLPPMCAPPRLYNISQHNQI